MKIKKLFPIVAFFLYSLGAIGQIEKIELIKEIIPGPDYSTFDDFAVLESKSLMIFSANDDEIGSELWVCDGTSEGTHLLKDINTIDYDGEKLGSDPEYFYAMGNYVYFRANDGIHGIELWRTDGTEEGTEMLADVYPEGMGGLSVGPNFCEYKNELYFCARRSLSEGYELWKTNGTAEGTVLVKDINTTEQYSSFPKDMVVYNDLLYFVAEYPGNHPNIFVTDGTADGTQLFYDINPDNSGQTGELTVCNNLIFFKGYTADLGLELYRTNGTAEGTFMLKDINNEGDGVNYSEEMISYNNELYFKGSSIEYGAELWKSDGSSEGTVQVKDINPEFGSYALSSSPIDFEVFDGKLFFRASDSDYNNKLWVSNGTEEGTVKYTDINNNELSAPRTLTVCNNRLYLVADHEETAKLASISSVNSEIQFIYGDDFTYNSTCSFMQLMDVNNNLYFHARLESDKGYELYKLVENTDRLISISETEITIIKDEVFQLNVDVDPVGENDVIVWESLNDDIVTVTDDGLVTAIYGGQTKIIAILQGTDKADTCIVNVKMPVEDVILTPDQVNLSVGETKLATAIVMPGFFLVDASVSWKSMNENVATVNNGLIIAIGGGETEIVVTTVSGGFTDTCKVTVSNPNGIDDFESIRIKVYPNPADNFINIEGTNPDSKIEIIGLDGQLYITSLNNQFIEVSYLKPGIYIVKIISNNMIYTHKFIKK